MNTQSVPSNKYYGRVNYGIVYPPKDLIWSQSMTFEQVQSELVRLRSEGHKVGLARIREGHYIDILEEPQ